MFNRLKFMQHFIKLQIHSLCCWTMLMLWYKRYITQGASKFKTKFFHFQTPCLTAVLGYLRVFYKSISTFLSSFAVKPYCKKNNSVFYLFIASQHKCWRSVVLLILQPILRQSFNFKPSREANSLKPPSPHCLTTIHMTISITFQCCWWYQSI